MLPLPLLPIATILSLLPWVFAAPLAQPAPAKIWNIPDECYDNEAHFYGYCSPLEVGRSEPKGFGFRTHCGCYSPCQVCKGCHCQHSRWAGESKRTWPMREVRPLTGLEKEKIAAQQKSGAAAAVQQPGTRVPGQLSRPRPVTEGQE